MAARSSCCTDQSGATAEVTAKVTTLEDLGALPASFFNAEANGGDPQPLKTVLVDETSLRKYLLPMEPLSWPPLPDGPLKGKVTTKIVVDHQGKVREIGPVDSENPGVDDVGRQAFAAMRFQPFLMNGMPVQAMPQVAIPFKTVRPVGTGVFERAHLLRARQTRRLSCCWKWNAVCLARRVRGKRQGGGR
jgi:hypothetical protein